MTAIELGLALSQFALLMVILYIYDSFKDLDRRSQSSALRNHNAVLGQCTSMRKSIAAIDTSLRIAEHSATKSSNKVAGLSEDLREIQDEVFSLKSTLEAVGSSVVDLSNKKTPKKRKAKKVTTKKRR